MLGRDTMRRFRTLMETDTAPALSLANIQAHKLRRLLTLVEQHCPFYRDRFRAAGLDVRDPGLTAGALRSLPLLERADVTNHLRELTWHDCPGGPPQPYNTGGSTGSPLKFYIDRCRQAADWLAGERVPGGTSTRATARSCSGPVRSTARDTTACAICAITCSTSSSSMRST
jgi:phenylacetate-CoA ligase